MDARATRPPYEPERRAHPAVSESDARRLLAVIPEECGIDREEHAVLVARVVARARGANGDR